MPLAGLIVSAALLVLVGHAFMDAWQVELVALVFLQRAAPVTLDPGSLCRFDREQRTVLAHAGQASEAREWTRRAVVHCELAARSD
jgi:hypothetical protein